MEYSSVFASTAVVIGAVGIVYEYYYNKDKKPEKDPAWRGFYSRKKWLPRLDSVAQKWKFMHESENKTYDFREFRDVEIPSTVQREPFRRTVTVYTKSDDDNNAIYTQLTGGLSGDTSKSSIPDTYLTHKHYDRDAVFLCLPEGNCIHQNMLGHQGYETLVQNLVAKHGDIDVIMVDYWKKEELEEHGAFPIILELQQNAEEAFNWVKGLYRKVAVCGSSKGSVLALLLGLKFGVPSLLISPLINTGVYNNSGNYIPLDWKQSPNLSSGGDPEIFSTHFFFGDILFWHEPRNVDINRWRNKTLLYQLRVRLVEIGYWEIWEGVRKKLGDKRKSEIGRNTRLLMIEKLEGLRTLTGSLRPGWSNLENSDLPPIMILQGDQDRFWINEGRKRDWIRALVDTGKAEFLLFTGVGHGGMKDTKLRSYAKSFLVSQLRE